MQNMTTYDFRGFRLLKANYSRIKDKPFNSFSLYVQKGIYSEETKIYEIIAEVTMTFGDETNAFAFSAGYKINDTEWLEVMAEQTILNELFRVVFPFLREKLFAYTSDFRPGIMLPIINLNDFDVTKKIVFNLNKPENLTN